MFGKLDCLKGKDDYFSIIMLNISSAAWKVLKITLSQVRNDKNKFMDIFPRTL